jgi:hypothetical protein
MKGFKCTNYYVKKSVPVLDPYPVQDTDRESSVPDWYESVLFDLLNPDPE